MEARPAAIHPTRTIAKNRMRSRRLQNARLNGGLRGGGGGGSRNERICTGRTRRRCGAYFTNKDTTRQSDESTADAATRYSRSRLRSQFSVDTYWPREA